MKSANQEKDFYPLCNAVWQKLFRFKHLFKDWENCKERKDEETICQKLRAVHNELQDILESMHKIINYAKENRQISEDCQTQLNLINQVTSAIYQQIHGKETVKSAAAVKVQSTAPDSKMGLIMKVTGDEFLSIPGYLKGRLTLVQINECITMINQALTKKYEIMKLPRNSLKPKDKIMQDSYKKQMTPMVKGMRFITIDDLKQFTGYKVSTANTAKFMVLRHLNRFKEIREPQEPVRYALC